MQRFSNGFLYQAVGPGQYDISLQVSEGETVCFPSLDCAQTNKAGSYGLYLRVYIPEDGIYGEYRSCARVGGPGAVQPAALN